jgi:Cerato-platanin
MIYFTTFIFTLLLSHIARAVPACGDDASPKDLYDTSYDDVQQPLFIEYRVEYDEKYDHKNGDTKKLACGHSLAPRYPHLKDIPHYPYIGAAFDIHKGSHNCGKCWKLHNKKTNKTISLSAVDSTEKGFKVSKEAYEKLGGKPGGHGHLDVEAEHIPPSVCGFK